MIAGIEARPDAVRVLPFRVRPLPDEPFDSWLETMAARYRSTISEMACALGLIEQKHGLAVSATRWMAAGWATTLTFDEAGRLEDSTGIPAAHFQEMTRMRFARHAIRHTRSGRISARCPVGGAGGRFCPECLLDSGGRWRMSWQFPFGFACPRHRKLLLDVCPACGQPARFVGHPLAEIPVPGQCHNRLEHSGGPTSRLCRADLTAATDADSVSDAVLGAQRRMMRIVSTGDARFGIYSRATQPAVRVFEDIRLLARAALDALDTGQDNHIAGLPREVLPAGLSSSRTNGAARAAAGHAAAIGALEDETEVAELLQGRIARSTSYTQHTPQLQALIAASLGRRRRPTAFLQSAPLSERDPAERARKVPAQMWDPWLRRFAPLRVGREVAATALSAAVVFTGTRLTHSAALALIDPDAPVRQVTHVMRSLGSADQDAETLHALLRLTCYLDEHEPPIDYARRRSLDYRVLLPEVQWATLCREANIAAGGGTRWRTAHAALYRQLSGNPLRSLRVDGHGAATERQVDQFARALPPTLRQALDSVGQEFLNAHGICEPTTWTPDLDDLRVDLAPPSGAEEFMPARPAAAVAQQVMSTASIAAAYTAGASTYALAPRMGVSRQTVSRLLAETSTPTRRGRPRVHNIDEMRVHEMYWVQDLTIRKIAQTFGCSSSTIARRLHAYEAVSGDGAQ